MKYQHYNLKVAGPEYQISVWDTDIQSCYGL